MVGKDFFRVPRTPVVPVAVASRQKHVIEFDDCPGVPESSFTVCFVSNRASGRSGARQIQQTRKHTRTRVRRTEDENTGLTHFPPRCSEAQN